MTQKAVASASAVAPSAATTLACTRRVRPRPVAGSTMWEYRTPSISTNWWVSPLVASD
jgi:hypothetical protein